jgi:hypothetical protein
VISARLASRVERNGRARTDLVVELAQNRRGYLDPNDQAEADAGKLKADAGYDFDFRGGVTMLIDTDTGRVRYVISKSVDSNRRLSIERTYLTQPQPGMPLSFYGGSRLSYLRTVKDGGELFAMLHGNNRFEEDF